MPTEPPPPAAEPRVAPEAPLAPGVSAEVADAHVHLFPPRVFEAIWRWFDEHAWHVEYPLYAEQVVEFLRARGVSRMIALHYSHRPGMARVLNRFVADVAARSPEVVPVATVLPGEPDADEILAEALGPLGLRGVKLHCHVQRLSPDDPRLEPVFRRASEAGVPVVIHSGRAPCLGGYGVDVRTLCGAERTRRVLQRWPKIKLVVPHLGADEVLEHFAMLDEFENLWLDTTMALASYFEAPPDPALLVRHADRLLYGSDFPNLPYAWDTELAWLRAHLPPDALAKILGGTAAALFTP